MHNRLSCEPSDCGLGYAAAHEAAEEGYDLDEWLAGVVRGVADEKALRDIA